MFAVHQVYAHGAQGICSVLTVSMQMPRVILITSIGKFSALPSGVHTLREILSLHPWLTRCRACQGLSKAQILKEICSGLVLQNLLGKQQEQDNIQPK